MAYKSTGSKQSKTGSPGKAAMRVKPRMSGTKFEGGANSYSPPRLSRKNKQSKRISGR